MKFSSKPPKFPKRSLERLDKLAKSLDTKDSVKVGLPRGSNDYPDGTSVITVGAVHEFGSPARNIPQRSYLRSTIVENKEEYFRIMSSLAKKIVGGDLSMQKALHMLGMKLQNDVQNKIEDIKEPPLKSREGNPLIDTGHLRQSIVYKVEE